MSNAEQLYERVLVLRCKTGDESAFAELIDRYQPRLRYYLRQLVREPHAVDDLLQDVWLDVFRSITRLENISAFPAWVYKIARFRALRRWRRYQPSGQPFHAEDVVAGDDNETNLTAENAEYIRAALHRIGEEQREVLVLRFLEEMSYEDIAQVIGCPVGTVGSRIHYAKLALRSALERTTCHE